MRASYVHTAAGEGRLHSPAVPGASRPSGRAENRGAQAMATNWHELHRTIVMPAHCDAYGHMNVRHYAAMFDEAGWHILARAGVSLSSLRSLGLGSVVANLTIDFHHELTAGQLVLVTGAFTRAGQKSFAYEMRLHEVDSMTHCATQKTIEVCFDTARRASAPLPAEIRAAIQRQVV
jgi:acyl-CoA thioester hydrolase